MKSISLFSDYLFKGTGKPRDDLNLSFEIADIIDCLLKKWDISNAIMKYKETKFKN